MPIISVVLDIYVYFVVRFYTQMVRDATKLKVFFIKGGKRNRKKKSKNLYKVRDNIVLKERNVRKEIPTR